DPDILAHVYDTAARLSRRVMLARVYISLFGILPTDTMEQLLGGTRLKHLHPGEALFRRGDAAEGLHIIASGRLTITTYDTEGESRVIDEIGSNETIGEFALMTDSRRAFDVYATRESLVAELDRAHFDQHIMSDPDRIASLSRMIVTRQINQTHQTERRPDQNFVLVPLDRHLPLRRFVKQLRQELAGDREPLALDSRSFDVLYGKKGVSQTSYEDLFSSTISAWMDDKENHNEHMLYVTETRWSNWTRRCVNRADRIILVANAAPENKGHLRSIEKELERLFQGTEFRPRVELVLLHPPETLMPTGTEKWLRPRRLDAFHHVRLGDTDHTARLARRLNGKARGLVFSGGGARGFAHLGVQRAIEENTLDIDYIGGSSMGGLLGGAMALGLSSEQVSELCKCFANSRALFDYTLPVTSMMTSRKLTIFCQEVYAESRIEDLWIPFFCVSSNLTNGREVVHQRGLLWKAIRSTISLPGVFSPVPTDDGELLIDGAVLNTFPVDIMRQKLSGGHLIGVNVSQIDEVRDVYTYGTSLSGWRSFFSRINPFVPRIHAPKIIEVLLRSTDIKSIQRLNATRKALDVLVEPDVSAIPLLEFKSFERIAAMGYEEAQKVLFATPVVTEEASQSDSNSDVSISPLGNPATS
ncbi:MAG: cyclic nucleotide-binding domain-containing protein, partial [Gammaproteobacteria bacterium]|nr:cyclic nucleotide-binding domain-containing protein [Gammaproteobacteria bacterium]